MFYRKFIFIILFTLTYSPTAYAFHGSIFDSKIVQYCNSLCNPISSLGVGSIISLSAQMNTFGMNVKNTIANFTIKISDISNNQSNTLLLKTLTSLRLADFLSAFNQ